ncbi:MAG: hypothetical protein ACJA08_001304 [Cyclobacteriaceae bacterium]|jgi:hypothetical protein
MVKSNPKSTSCHNCGTSLKKEFEYCPHCGQQNNDSHLSFSILVKEFFSNYFSFDSRFGRTIKPFFLNPGELTSLFMDGKRVRFANPIRLYLVISLMHFFVFSFVPDKNVPDGELLNLGNSNRNKSAMISFDIDPTKESDTTDMNQADDEFAWLPNGGQFEKIFFLSNDKTLTYQNICDSLKVSDMTGFKKYTTKQFIRLQMSDTDSISSYMIKNVPVLMFILLPIYALILKLFFRKKRYIHHLIHSIHLHSFMFMMLTLMWFSRIIFPALEEFFGIAVFFILCLYVVISFIKNYSLSKLKATFSMLLSGMIYSIVLIFGLVAEILISLMIF